MPKAEATTGLAPKNASVIDPLVAASSSPQRVLFWISPVSLVKSLRSGGLGLHNAKHRRAAFARRAAAFIGSHNLTGFALCGLNGEAGVLLDGPGASDPFPEVRAHINAALAESLQYDPNQRDALAWWAGQFMEGLADKFDDYPRDGEAKKTIIILAQHSGQGLPKSGDVIYFELPKAIGKVQSLSSEVHLYLFDTLPASPVLALSNLAGARTSLWCKTIGVEDDRGGRELQAEWYVDGTRPVLRRAPRPFRPTPAADMQQVRARAYNEVRRDLEYLFEPAKPAFEPIFDRTQQIGAHGELAKRWESLKLVPPEHLPWFRVTGLQRKEEPTADDRYLALRKLTPPEGAFILMSMRRRSRLEE